VLVADRFRVARQIASGGFGEVWAAEDIHLHNRVALKVLRRDTSANQEVMARFAREAYLLGQIRSSHVVRAIDFITETKHGPVLALEFVEGSSLANVLRWKRLSVEEAVHLGIDLATALRDLHSANIVHRDVKPANIILQPLHDAGHRAVFVDLGVSRLLPGENQGEEEQLTEITGIDRAVGTLEYMAPEQILSSRSVTAEADIYALGAILYRAVAGRGLFNELRGAELVQSKLNVDPPPLETGRSDRVAVGLETLVSRALARKLDDRYEVIDEILTDLSLLRDAMRRTAARRESTERASVAPAVEPPPPSPVAKAIEMMQRLYQSALTPWGARALILALGVSIGLAVSVARAEKSSSAKHAAVPLPASKLIDGDCHVERQSTEGREDPSKGHARTSFVIVCDD
jgi:serine/threonine-protein kinase